MDDQRTCRICGCTEDNACPEGCWWVEWDLCSACEAHEPVLCYRCSGLGCAVCNGTGLQPTSDELEDGEP